VRKVAPPRNHEAQVKRQVFTAIGIDEEEAERRFGFLLEALRYGAPPHGGIAFGIDRIIALIAGRDSIRDVIAFPKTASGANPLTGAPAPVEQRQLRAGPAADRAARPLSGRTPVRIAPAPELAGIRTAAPPARAS